MCGSLYDVVGMEIIARGLCPTMKAHVLQIYQIRWEF